MDCGQGFKKIMKIQNLIDFTPCKAGTRLGHKGLQGGGKELESETWAGREKSIKEDSR